MNRLVKMLTRVSGNFRTLCAAAMLLSGATFVVGMSALLTGPASAKVCSKKDAQEKVEKLLGGKGRLESMNYDKDSRGFRVRIKYNSGETRDFFIRRDRC